MKQQQSLARATAAGFSLLELMIVVVLVLIVTGAVFNVINLSTARSATEQTKLDMFQEAREFMDQMSRDLRQAGYPNPRNVDQTVLTQDPIKNDSHAAVGLVKIDDGDLWFEGDVDGSGIRNGKSRVVKPGDVIFIPPGVPHQITAVNGEIQFLLFRWDTK
jgi:prepilin-type N-terminal cleavage/methylation domain-containing protein